MRKAFRFNPDLPSEVPCTGKSSTRYWRAKTLLPGDQFPTVRQLAVDRAINPNPVVRAYRELEIRDILSTQQGTGTFITKTQPKQDGMGLGGMLATSSLASQKH